MNTRRTDQPPARDAGLEREWQLQERALHEERTGAAPPEDPAVADYRRIVHALRRPLPERLPSNFAYQVARLAARLPKASRLDLRLERWLVRGLVVALSLGALVAAARYGRDWVRTIETAGPATTGWLGLLAACLLLTWGMQGWRALRRGSEVD